MALMSGLGALLGFASNTTGARTSTSTTTPGYTPGQTGLQNDLTGYLSSAIANGGPDTTALQTQGTDTINKATDSLNARMEKFTASRGFGQSGTTGMDTQKNELNRVGQIGNLTSSLAGYRMNMEQNLIGDSLKAAYSNPSSSTVNVGAGSPVAGGLAGLLYMLGQQQNTGVQAMGGN